MDLNPSPDSSLFQRYYRSVLDGVRHKLWCHHSMQKQIWAVDEEEKKQARHKIRQPNQSPLSPSVINALNQLFPASTTTSDFEGSSNISSLFSQFISSSQDPLVSPVRDVMALIHPDMKMTNGAVYLISYMIHEFLYRILQFCNSKQKQSQSQQRDGKGEAKGKGKDETLTDNRITAILVEQAVQNVMKGQTELLKHAISEGTKAVKKYRDFTSSSSAAAPHTLISLTEKANLMFPVSAILDCFRWFFDFSLNVDSQPLHINNVAGTSINETNMNMDQDQSANVKGNLTADSSSGKLEVETEAAVYAAAVLEYLAAEALELSGNSARNNNAFRVVREIVEDVVCIQDKELVKLFSDTCNNCTPSILRPQLLDLNSSAIHIHDPYYEEIPKSAVDTKAGITEEQEQELNEQCEPPLRVGFRPICPFLHAAASAVHDHKKVHLDRLPSCSDASVAHLVEFAHPAHYYTKHLHTKCEDFHHILSHCSFATQKRGVELLKKYAGKSKNMTRPLPITPALNQFFPPVISGLITEYTEPILTERYEWEPLYHNEDSEEKISHYTVPKRASTAIRSQKGGKGYYRDDIPVPMCTGANCRESHEKELLFQFRLSDLPPTLAFAHAINDFPIQRQLLQCWGCQYNIDDATGRIVDMKDDWNKDENTNEEPRKRKIEKIESQGDGNTTVDQVGKDEMEEEGEEGEQETEEEDEEKAEEEEENGEVLRGWYRNPYPNLQDDKTQLYNVAYEFKEKRNNTTTTTDPAPSTATATATSVTALAGTINRDGGEGSPSSLSSKSDVEVVNSSSLLAELSLDIYLSQMSLVIPDHDWDDYVENTTERDYDHFSGFSSFRNCKYYRRCPYCHGAMPLMFEFYSDINSVPALLYQCSKHRQYFELMEV